MTRVLNWFNFFGVVALAALCVAQWSHQRGSDNRIARLEDIRVYQADEIERQKLQLLQNEADLAEFRNRIAAAEKSLSDKSERLAAKDRMLAEVSAERDELKSSLTKWKAAVSERDAAIRGLNLQVQKIAAERDAAIAKYNNLAVKSPATTTSN